MPYIHLWLPEATIAIPAKIAARLPLDLHYPSWSCLAFCVDPSWTVRDFAQIPGAFVLK